MIAARRVTEPALPDIPPPLAALRVDDDLRRRALERALATAPESEADVLVIALRIGESVPPDAMAFDGVVLVLSDDATVAADTTLAGVLPFAASERQVAAAVAALAEGLVVRTPAPSDAGFAARDPAVRPLLTPREVEVLALVGQGMSNKAIARRLNISAHTVKYHLEAIFAKLGVRSRAEAVTRGLRLGVHLL
jgi:DNA-binding NarL/FixJ family response regulator